MLRNAVGSDMARQLTLAASIVVGGFFALMGFLALYSVRLSEEWGPPLAVVGCAAILLGWLLFPLLGFGSDETLDPERLALFPLPRRSLMLGLFGASLIGVPALATLVALSGGVLGYGAGLAAPFAVAAVLALLAASVTGSRALVTVLAPVLRSRRGRDSAILGIVLASALLYGSQLLLPRGDGDPNATLRRFRAAAATLRPTPLGWAGDALVAARDGRYGTAALEVAGLLALAAAFAWVWSWALDRSLTTAPAAAPVHEAGGGALAPWPLRALLPHGPLGAVAARELRYVLREPRRRANVLGSAVFAAIMPALAFRDSLSTARPFMLLYPAVVLGLSTANHFGLDGPAWWLHLSAGVPPRADLAGRNIALVCYAVPILVVQSVVVVVLGTSPVLVAALLAMALGAFGIASAFSDVASVRAAFALPESKTNPWATNTNAGCATGLYNAVAMLATGLALTPSAVLVVVGDGRVTFTLAAVVLALAIGGGAWWAGLAIASRDLEQRGPHILSVIDPRRG